MLKSENHRSTLIQKSEIQRRSHVQILREPRLAPFGELLSMTAQDVWYDESPCPHRTTHLCYHLPRRALSPLPQLTLNCPKTRSPGGGYRGRATGTELEAPQEWLQVPTVFFRRRIAISKQRELGSLPLPPSRYCVTRSGCHRREGEQRTWI